MVFSLIRRLFTWYTGLFWKALEAVKQTVTTFLTFIVVLLVLLWMSTFLYGSFYYNYIPAESHRKDVNFHFRHLKKTDGLRSFPEANLSLVTDNRQQLLSAGQAYRIALGLEMPESPLNQALGMFMVKLSFYSRHGEVVYDCSRSSMLRYKSNLFQIFETIFYVPLMLMGYKEQAQTLEVDLVSNFNQDPYKPALGVHIIVESRHIEIYAAELRIEAQFTGVRYILHRWPGLSALFGISLSMTFLSLVALLSWYNLVYKDDISESSRGPILHNSPSPSISFSQDGKNDDSASRASTESADDFTDVSAEIEKPDSQGHQSEEIPENLSTVEESLLRLRTGFSGST